MDIKKYYSHVLFEADVASDTAAVPNSKPGLTDMNKKTDGPTEQPAGAKKPATTTVSTDTLDGDQTTDPNTKAASRTEIFIAFFYNNMKSMGPKLDTTINDAIKEAETENGIKGARGFAGIAGAEWIVLRRSIFYATLIWILLRYINKTGADAAKSSIASAEAKAKNLKPSKSKEQKNKEKELKKSSTNEDIEYIESLADVGGLIKTIIQRAPTKGVNKVGTYRYFVKDVKTAYGIILGTKDGVRYCRAPIGSGKNHVERYFDFANLNQTYATTLQYIRNMANGKSPNSKWDQLSPEILQKTLQGSAFQLSYGEVSRVATEMAKQMFLIAYENEDIKVNKAHEKVTNALSNATGIRPEGTKSDEKVLRRVSKDELK